ncbi:similar to Saccharomyces cerevisiae YDR503C LPP1 Lipid phosphate phosphatase [Maudiozyma saulgeensis]|uniref:Similar to Saccharomyces cerevisiae YDR503C LPP1 Lipid phosphate phosphatase n=1 Tax=Maudiozyma saulgeensis TaxID=1789683 RepID=A0A1X7R6H4_9SACH|nr:similar to Saccharomyces cerevisiae YDR503C LPP1 Lipid phosphate phosphatase [Kazachstania saulgeensis]
MAIRKQVAPLIAYARTYYFQYTVILLCSIFFIYSEFKLVPRWETIKFQLNDPSIGKEFKDDELVSDIECVLMAVLIGMIIISWYCLMKSHKQSIKKLAGPWLNNKPEWLSKEYHLFHISVLCLALILSINGTLTNSLKLIIGNTRPDFLERCQPDSNQIQNGDPNAYYTAQICTQKDTRLLYDGLKSTPSGHSSFIMCGLGFIYFWQCKFISGNPLRNIWCLFLITIVMISRIVDHKHHWYDVISGGLLGVGIVITCWRWMFIQKRASASVLPPPISL